MKKTGIFSFMALLSCFIFAQESAVISVEKNNFMYAGINNLVSIAVPGVTPDQISIEVVGGVAEKIGNSIYTIIPKPETKELLIHVFSGTDESKTNHGTSHFRIKQVPEPDCYLGSFNLSDNPAISKGQINAMPLLVYRSSITDIEIPVPVITSFKLSFQNSEDDYFEKNINGNKISGDVISEISKLKEGVQIFITDIYVSQNNQSRIMTPCSFTVN